MYAASMDGDLELFKQWQQGDAAAGEALFERHFDDVYRFFRKKCVLEVDDLVQQTFLSCVKSRDRFRAESSFRTYLFTIAKNKLYDTLRKQKRHMGKLDFGVTSLGEVVTTPRTKISRNEEAERLHQRLAELPLDDQILLELRYWQNLNATDLSRLFDVPPATIRTRLRRARIALEKKLGNLDENRIDFERLEPRSD